MIFVQHDIIILVAALVFEALAGKLFFHLFSYIAHPVRFVGWGIDFVSRIGLALTKRPFYRRILGVLVAIGAIVLAAMLGIVGQSILAKWTSIGGRAIGVTLEIGIVAIFFCQYELHERIRRVMAALAKGDNLAARRACSHIVGRDLDPDDTGAMARAAIESGAENLSDGIIAPAFFYALFGLPGILVYKTISTMDSMIGYRSPQWRDFGMAAARIDDVANFIPARLSALIIILASSMTGGRASAAWRCVWGNASSHASPNAGWPEAAFAGALGVSLAGPRRYGTVRVNDPLIEPSGGGRMPDADDIGRALRLYRGACAGHIVMYGVISGVIGACYVFPGMIS